MSMNENLPRQLTYLIIKLRWKKAAINLDIRCTLKNPVECTCRAPR